MTDIIKMLEEIRDEITEEHRQNRCNCYGSCDIVEHFVEHLKEHEEDLEALEDWYLQGSERQQTAEHFYDQVFGRGFVAEDWIAPENIWWWRKRLGCLAEKHFHVGYYLAGEGGEGISRNGCECEFCEEEYGSLE